MAARAPIPRLCAGAAALLLLGGCSLWAPERPEPVRIEVPVPVSRPAPPELLGCTKGLPLPRFEACGEDGWSCLPPAEEGRLRALLDRLMRCDEGWRAWAAPQSSED